MTNNTNLTSTDIESRPSLAFQTQILDLGILDKIKSFAAVTNTFPVFIVHEQKIIDNCVQKGLSLSQTSLSLRSLDSPAIGRSWADSGSSSLCELSLGLEVEGRSHTFTLPVFMMSLILASGLNCALRSYIGQEITVTECAAEQVPQITVDLIICCVVCRERPPSPRASMPHSPDPLTLHGKGLRLAECPGLDGRAQGHTEKSERRQDSHC